MEMKIPEGALQAVVAAAVVNALGSEERSKILTEAVEHVLTAKDGSYDRTTRFQRLLEAGIADAVKKIIDQRLNEKAPELRAHVDAVFEEAYREAVKVHKEALIANFAEAFKTCFVRRF